MKRAQGRRLSRLAYGLSVLFLAMAVGVRVLTGDWPFDGSLELVLVCIALGVVFQIVSMRRFASLPDPTALLKQALEVASTGRIDGAIGILSKAIYENPALWQAYQYRGELYLSLQNNTAAAADFAKAIQLAPEEQHLRELKNRAMGASEVISNCETMPEIRGSGLR